MTSSSLVIMNTPGRQKLEDKKVRILASGDSKALAKVKYAQKHMGCRPTHLD
jgi:hypothetical protein